MNFLGLERLSCRNIVPISPQTAFRAPAIADYEGDNYRE